MSPEGVDRLWRQSPLRNVASIHTPLLMLQAEADLRCPPQDNEQLFVALRHLRRTVEYVLYPEESHVFSSSGRPDRRIDRMTRMLTGSTATCARETSRGTGRRQSPPVVTGRFGRPAPERAAERVVTGRHRSSPVGSVTRRTNGPLSR